MTTHTPTLDKTHDPKARSWVIEANDGLTDFPIQNLPYAIFRTAGSDEAWRTGVAIGNVLLDVAHLVRVDAFTGDALIAAQAACADSLNPLMALGPRYWTALRHALFDGLHAGSSAMNLWRPALIWQDECAFALPAQVGDYTDFYTSIHHATRVGELFRPDQPLLPNYQWVPIGYHGRASSLLVSGAPIMRPCGQVKAPSDDVPRLAPSKRVDYELELAVYVGVGNDLGTPIALDDAPAHVFGFGLLNDWSARDLQAWEYQPLGPFLSKNFATSLSPWVVTMEALIPYRCAFTRPADHPQPLAYLDSAVHRETGGVRIQMDVFVQTDAMRAADAEAWHQVSSGNYADAYWTHAQMLAHHSVNGCNLRPGDVLGTGTQSGALREEAGALIELTRNGQEPITLANGETRGYLEDGDAVKMIAYCDVPTAVRLGFGAVVGQIMPARL